jgi:hypothetical protein
MAYSYSYNKQAAPDVLFGTISIDLGITPIFIDYDSQNFDIEIFFENQLAPQEESDLNAIISNYIYIDTGNYASFNSVYTAEFSATTINSGSTNLYGIFSSIANSGETNTVSNIGSGFGLFKQKSGVDFQFRTLSAGTNVSFSTGDTITLNVTNDGNDITRVQPGSNITTGGTANNPTINVAASPSFNSITASGASSFTTLSATTLVSGSTNLYNIFAQPGRVVNNVTAGSNITTGGTAISPTVSLVSSPSLNSITASGASSFTTLSATTLISGSTNLYNIFAQSGRVVNNVNAGSNITTGGTAISPTVNLVASPSFNGITFSGTAIGGIVQAGAGTFTSLSAGTLSGGTILSGGTNLYSIFATIPDQNDVTRVQPGSNITTGGTANTPIINLTASPSINNLTISGLTSSSDGATFVRLSGTSIFVGNSTTGGTIQAEKELVLQQTGDTFGSSIFRLRNRNGENGAIFETTDPTITLVDFIFKTAANQRNIRYESRTSDSFLSAPEFEFGQAANPSLVIGDAGILVRGSGGTRSTSLSSTTISGNTLFLQETTTPSTPVSAATIFVRNKANRRMAGQVGPSGIDYTFQPSVYGNKIALWNPPGNATTVPGVLGMAALTAQGTATARNVTTTNLLTRTKRLSVASGNPAGSLAGYRLGVAQYTMGNGSGAGGFMYVIRFGVADARTATRMFIGLRNSTATPTNVEPSTITNCIGVGNGVANTNLFIYYGGSAAQTPINLGANFPCNTNSADLYELTLFSSPNSNNSVGYRVERLNTGDVASGTLTGVAGTALPASTTLLTLNDFRTNALSNGVVALDYVSIYIETDY